ncbi:diguanylate cyclase [Sulfurimonas sp.]|uniref:GGDEF domain-containing protein n=1 Tax=Sulfurimonas sp. TaxID=2022749 RepID=UPI003D10DA99
MDLEKTKLYETLFFSNMQFSEYSSELRKVVMINILLIITGIISLIFSIYNFALNNILLGFIDLVGFVMIVIGYFDLRISQNINRAAFATTALVFVFMVGIVYFGQGKNFTLIWSVFFPVFAIFINGSKKGIYVSAIFYLVVFLISYQGIGIWQDGLWNNASFWRLFIASIGITIILYFFEVSFEKASEQLAKNREKEQQYIEQLETFSITDPLTKLYNRRYLTKQFSVLFEKAKKHNSYFAFYVFDLDFFKQYNDTYGHIAGDTVLKKIAWTLTHNIFKREVDHVFRLGGEEFCGLIIANDLTKIQQSLQNAKQSIEDLGLEHPKGINKVLTASFGVAIINEFSVEDFDKVYKIADQALYEAKAQGRNCIVGDDKVSILA